MEWEESLCRTSARTVVAFPWEDHIWWVSSVHGKKQCGWWCAACGGQCDWRAPGRILVTQRSPNANDAKVLKAHAAPLGLCDNLVNALKFLANQQEDGDSPIESIVTAGMTEVEKASWMRTGASQK